MTRKTTIVMGAGMVGVSIAWHLRARGREVLLIDRCQPGSETSFGNAGLIQREAVNPHPFPRNPLEICRLLPNVSVDVRYRLLAMFEQMRTLWQFWKYSAPASYARILPEYASLIMHATADHQTMISAAAADHLIERKGWLQVYRSARALQRGLEDAVDFEKRFGVGYEHLDAASLHALEPHLSDKVIGAIHWTNSWAVTDPGELVAAYANHFTAAGGKVERASVTAIEQQAGRWRVETDAAAFEADELVLATGPWSPEWLRRLGYCLPMFVQRGYHMHYGSAVGARLGHSVMDIEKGYVVGPKSGGLRLTTGAELNTLGALPRVGQLAAAERALRDIYPLGQRSDSRPWLGARPCLADMKPVIGAAHRHANLWFAFGHGHQGFTLGPTTGRLLGQMMDAETPDVDMHPFRSDRFERKSG